MITAGNRTVAFQHTSYRDRGFIDTSRRQPKSVATKLTNQKQTINIATGTISNRKTEKLPNGRSCISFTINVPSHNEAHKIQMYAAGSNMLAIMRHPAKTEISLVRKFNREFMRYEMISVATEEEKSHDISGLWVIRQSDIELDDNLSRLRHSQTLLTYAQFMTGNMVIIRTPAGKTFPIMKALLTRP